MKTHLLIATLSALFLLPSLGCVAQRKYDELELAYRKSQEQVVELQGRIDELTQEIELLKAGPRSEADKIRQLMDERDQLMQQLEDLRSQYASLAQQPGPVVLPPEVDQALRDFARQNPNIAEYDAARGMVKFRSDLTFALGSAEVTSEATPTLRQLAEVLRGAAAKYEIRIVGHTDAVPISRAATRAKHPTNWHLSVHRAIAVRDVLEEAGIDAVRTHVAGYGTYRPVVPNTRTGAEANRRVEIYLVAMTPVNEQWLQRTGSGAGEAAPSSQPVEQDIPLK